MDEERDPVPTPNSGGWAVRIQTLWGFVRRLVPLFVLFLFTILGVFLYNVLFPAPVPPSPEEIDASINQAMASATPEEAYAAQVYQTILPSLVLIQTRQGNEHAENGFGVGSGVVINDRGDILTAHHVVAEAEEIEVFFSDGSRARAAVFSGEPENDIAVLQPERPPEFIVPAVLGNPGAMRIGDEAFAVGNPLGYTASMSAGVISGFNRSVTANLSEIRLEGLIQFDTAVNPGSSGGPLLNRQGQVIGIVTALANPSEENFFIGIGFAVPIGVALSAAGGPSY